MKAIYQISETSSVICDVLAVRGDRMDLGVGNQLTRYNVPVVTTEVVPPGSCRLIPSDPAPASAAKTRKPRHP